MKLVISMGDATGVGPEVALKAVAAESTADDASYLLTGDIPLLLRLNKELGINLPLKERGKETGRFLMHNPFPEPLPQNMLPGSSVAARAAVAWLADAGQRCLRREMDALITAPVNKESIINTGQPFIGATEFLSDLAGTKDTIMMLLGSDDRGRWLRVALATTHVPLRLVAAQLQAEKIDLAIRLAAQACRDLGLSNNRIAVCGLNPHAGEGGKMGNEEILLIRPVIQAAQRKGLNVTGPLPADTLFHQAYKGDFEIVIAMYHDQGLAPLKMIAFENGVNWTLGLPFIRTSPDHGTAHDIAGQNKADPSSTRSAIRLAKQIARNRAA